MRASGGTRVEWSAIPADVRASIGTACGSEVVEARNQHGGFSPGLAARCRLGDGRRVFVKAVSPDQNPQACRIHRREIEIASLLPASVPAPRLLATVDDGHWVALVFDEISGHQPAEPWTVDSLDVVIPQLRRFSEDATPNPVQPIQSVIDRYRPVFHGWRRLADDDGPTSDLDPWLRENLDRLAETEAGWETAAAGDTLLHTDLRADNLLVDGHDRVWLVDWPWACQGAAFVDMAFLLPSVGLDGGPPPAEVAARYGLFEGVGPDHLRAIVAALAGFFTRASFDPAPPGLPTLRRFQRAQADVANDWLRELLGQS